MSFLEVCVRYNKPEKYSMYERGHDSGRGVVQIEYFGLVDGKRKKKKSNFFSLQEVVITSCDVGAATHHCYFIQPLLPLFP